MIFDSELAELAKLHGIILHYQDMRGQQCSASPETLRALLAAKGVEVDGRKTLRDSLYLARQQMRERQFPNEIIVVSQRESSLQFDSDQSWLLRSELSDEIIVSGGPTDRIVLPPLQSGVYLLDVGNVEQQPTITVIAAPPCAPCIHEITGKVRLWGINLALYGLKSSRNTGVGDYDDLKEFTRVVGRNGVCFVGINPIHAMGHCSGSFSPYSPSHRGFLNTSHISSDRIPGLQSSTAAQQILSDAEPQKAELRSSQFIDYKRHASLHKRLMSDLYEVFRSDATEQSRTDLARFKNGRGDELIQFAQFESTTERLGSDWHNWDDHTCNLTDHKRVEFHIWLQWVADCQLKASQCAALDSGMKPGLYLDLAVGAQRNGAESWCERNTIVESVSVGAPPDHLNPIGQKWNLTAYSPEALAKQHYRPFRRLLTAAMRHAGIIRIDHILGFYRSFWIPDNGAPGGYVKQPFDALLALLKIEAERTNTVVIGEDLGIVPTGFRSKLRDNGIFGCSVMQFEDNWEDETPLVANIPDPLLSSFSTHDTPTVRGFETGRDIEWQHRLNWIDKDSADLAAAERQKQLRAVRDTHTAKEFSTCVHSILASSTATAVSVQLDDILENEEAQNLPGTIDEHPNWRRKYDADIATLSRDERFLGLCEQMNKCRGSDSQNEYKRCQMKTRIVDTEGHLGQVPGTSGLRKKTSVFMMSNYLENYIQAIITAIGGGEGKTFVVGGDGRYFNTEAIQTIIKIVAANGARRIIVATDGLLSTPAASNLIRIKRADGGFILSASHNPGGLDADFGVKYNESNGGPAREGLTDKITNATKKINHYNIAECADIELTQTGTERRGSTRIEVVDPVADYLVQMQRIFDFAAIRGLFAGGFMMRFDAMNAVTGPYAKTILEDCLGAPEGTVINGIPKKEFGGIHPDPNPVHAKPLCDLMMSNEAPDFAAASDGDGDRNLILGRHIYVTPSDSLAVLTANAHLAPAYANGLAGVARSMPTSGACDRVAEKLGIPCYETPTGWKYFGNLLDAGKITICGEESAGTGSNHLREKDGIWAVLLWLNILAIRKTSVADIMAEHWKTYGRDYYSRHDYEGINLHKMANPLINELRGKLAHLAGSSFAGTKVVSADEFSYLDPVDGSVSSKQGIRIRFEGRGRAVIRLSGTGTGDGTIRIYLERYEPVGGDFNQDTQLALKSVQAATFEICGIERHLGRTEPDVMT